MKTASQSLYSSGRGGRGGGEDGRGEFQGGSNKDGEEEKECWETDNKIGEWGRWATKPGMGR